jgi:xylulokinase
VTLTAVICAVDIGTSEIRAALVSETGIRLHEVAHVRSAEQQSPTFDTDVFWADVAKVLRSLVVGEADLVIKNVSVTSHIGQVILDKHGVSLIDAGSWSDVRGVDIFQSQIADDMDILFKAGKPRLTGGAIPLLVWLREKHPELHSRVRLVLAPKDFINFRLTGNISTDPTSAAYSFGYDVRNRVWDDGLISNSGIDPSCFPSLNNATEIVGYVARDISDLVGVPEGTPVVSGAPDGTLGAATLIGLTEGVIADISGTTDVLMTVTSNLAALDTRGVVINPFIIPDYWSYGGSTGFTGGATAHWSRILGFENVGSAMNKYGAEIESIPAGCDGLLMSPLLSGSRFPTWNSNERGAIWGLDVKHGPAHVLKASYESASFVVREAVAQFPLINGNKSSIRLAGGIVRSKHIVQMRADILGCTIHASKESNLSLQGAVLLGLTAAGIYSNFEEARSNIKSDIEIIYPNEVNSEIYNDVYKKWASIREKMNN